MTARRCSAYKHLSLVEHAEAAMRPGKLTAVKLAAAEEVLRVPMRLEEGAVEPLVMIPCAQERFELLARLSKRHQFHFVMVRRAEAEGWIVLGRGEEGVAAELPAEAE